MVGSTQFDAINDARSNLDKYDAMSKNLAAKIEQSNANAAKIMARTSEPGPMHGP